MVQSFLQSSQCIDDLAPTMPHAMMAVNICLAYWHKAKAVSLWIFESDVAFYPKRCAQLLVEQRFEKFSAPRVDPLALCYVKVEPLWPAVYASIRDRERQPVYRPNRRREPNLFVGRLLVDHIRAMLA